MAYICNNLAELQKAISIELEKGMNDLERDLKAELNRNLESFYKQGKPKMYVRTGALKKSGRTLKVGFGTVDQDLYVFMNPGMYHKVPNPAFDIDGTGRYSHFNAMEIYDATENHKHGVLGRGGYWRSTLAVIPHYMKYDIGNRFKAG